MSRCITPECHLLYWIILEKHATSTPRPPPSQPPARRSPAIESSAIERAQKTLADASISRRIQQLPANSFVHKRLNKHGVAAFAFHHQGKRSATMSAFHGVAIKMSGGASTWCKVNVTMAFDRDRTAEKTAGLPQVYSVPLTFFCGITGRKNGGRNGPVAIGFDINTLTCFVAFPMPFLRSAHVSFEAAPGTDLTVSIYANQTMHAAHGRIQYFAAEYRVATVRSACFGDAVHTVAKRDAGGGKFVGVHWYSDLHAHIYEGDHIMQWDRAVAPQFTSTGLEDFFRLVAYFSPDNTSQRHAFFGALAETRVCGSLSKKHKEGCFDIPGFPQYKDVVEIPGIWPHRFTGVVNSAYRHFILDPISFHDGFHYFVRLFEHHALTRQRRPTVEQCKHFFGGIYSVGFLYIDAVPRHSVQSRAAGGSEFAQPSSSALSLPRYPLPVATTTRALAMKSAATGWPTNWVPGKSAMSATGKHFKISSTSKDAIERTVTNVTYTALSDGDCQVIRAYLPRPVPYLLLQRVYHRGLLAEQTASVLLEGQVIGQWQTLAHFNQYEQHGVDSFLIGLPDHGCTSMKAAVDVTICPLEGKSWTAASYTVFLRGKSQCKK
jgi:hypothetical protein